MTTKLVNSKHGHTLLGTHPLLRNHVSLVMCVHKYAWRVRPVFRGISWWVQKLRFFYMCYINISNTNQTFNRFHCRGCKLLLHVCEKNAPNVGRCNVMKHSPMFIVFVKTISTPWKPPKCNDGMVEFIGHSVVSLSLIHIWRCRRRG